MLNLLKSNNFNLALLFLFANVMRLFSVTIELRT